MKNIGRNDPCPCGSGKKYKKCCLTSADRAEFQYRRWRQVEAGLITRLTKFAFENLGPEIVEEAWKDFNDHESVEDFDPASPMNMVFMPWFLFTWIFELKPTGSRKSIETTVAEQFLIHDRKRISPDEQTLLLSATRCPFTLCEVVEVKPGVGITQFDLLRRTKYEVIERLASQTLKLGEIIYCATTEVGGIRSNLATGPYALRPIAKRDVLDLRKWIKEQTGSEEITTEHLHEFSYDIRGLYLHLLAAMLTPPQLANTDGDLMVPQKLYFAIESADKAFHALKTLAKGWKEEELLLQRAELEDGSVVKVEIEWLGGKAEARTRLGGPVLLGLIKIDHERLIVEVNSNKRAGRIRRMIERRLGSGVKYKTTLIEPIEAQVQEAWHAAMAGDSESQNSSAFEGANRTPSIDEPELLAMMEEAARQHWESWFDLPVPALDDKTPREAARTAEGRELLNSLLLLYEHSADNQSEDLLKPDVAALRRELGLERSS